MSPTQATWLGVETKVSRFSVWYGALIGAWSHVLLDSIMHHDVVPFAPLTQANALVGLVSISNLYLTCLFASLAELVRLQKVGQIPWSNLRGISPHSD